MKRFLPTVLIILVFASPGLAQSDNLTNDVKVPTLVSDLATASPAADHNADNQGTLAASIRDMLRPGPDNNTFVAPRSLSGESSRILELAYADAKVILEQNNQCSQFFGGTPASIPLLDMVLRFQGVYLPNGLGIRMSGTFRIISSQKTGFTYRLFEKEEINRRGPFFNKKRFPDEPSVPNVGGFTPGSREVRVLMLLHELAHLIQGRNGNWLIPDDGNNMSQSMLNTMEIEKRCGKEIRSF